eukprot:Filipodium_phascolosomae@DN2032_c0_g1_i1.p2
MQPTRPASLSRLPATVRGHKDPLFCEACQVKDKFILDQEKELVSRSNRLKDMSVQLRGYRLVLDQVKAHHQDIENKYEQSLEIIRKMREHENQEMISLNDSRLCAYKALQKGRALEIFRWFCYKSAILEHNKQSAFTVWKQATLGRSDLLVASGRSDESVFIFPTVSAIFRKPKAYYGSTLSKFWM